MLHNSWRSISLRHQLRLHSTFVTSEQSQDLDTSNILWSTRQKERNRTFSAFWRVQTTSKASSSVLARPNNEFATWRKFLGRYKRIVRPVQGPIQGLLHYEQVFEDRQWISNEWPLAFSRRLSTPYWLLKIKRKTWPSRLTLRKKSWNCTRITLRWPSCTLLVRKPVPEQWFLRRLWLMNTCMAR